MYCKKIIVLIILLVSYHTVMAQRRACDMEAFCVSPSGKVPNGSQLRLSFGCTNLGPDVMYSGDTVLYSLYMVVNGEERPVYNGAFTGRPGNTINVGEKKTYADNYSIRFSFPDATDTLIVDFCVVLGSSGVNQNGDTVRPFSYDDPNRDNNKICNQVMVLPQRSTAINNLSEENFDMQIYPNPANNVLYIKAQSATQKTQQATIVDLTGRIVLERYFEQPQLHKGVLSLNIEQLPAGMYNVVLQSEENTTVEKLLITR